MPQAVKPSPGQHGFTLAELAIVLLIVTLLVGGIITPLAVQIEQRRREQTQQTLAEIREALIGYAVTYRRLPCPALSNDPAAPAPAPPPAPPCPGGTPGPEGWVPWKTLGTAGHDAWGSDLRYRVDGNFAAAAGLVLTPTPTAPSDGLVIHDSQNAGVKLTTEDNERPIAIVFSPGANRVADGFDARDAAGDAQDRKYQAGNLTESFDDMAMWLTRTLLFARMVAAGKLP